MISKKWPPKFWVLYKGEPSLDQALDSPFLGVKTIPEQSSLFDVKKERYDMFPANGGLPQ